MNILQEIKRIFRGEVPLSVLLKRGLTVGSNFSMQSSVRCDYFKYQDTILRTPKSKDSKEYKLFLKLYQEQN